MNIQDRKKSLTAEELRQRYNFEDIERNKKATELIRETLNKVEVQFQRFIDIINRSLSEYPSQADGNITAWFFNGIPTISQPEFTTPADHLGDVYYDRDNGKAYEYKMIDVFDKNNSNIINGLLADSGKLNANDGWRTLYIPVQINTVYTISKIKGQAFRVAEFQNMPATGNNWTNRVVNNTGTTITYTTSEAGNYLAITYFGTGDDLTEQEIYDSIKVITEPEWVEITDSRTIEVLSIEASAADTADNSRVVNIVQPTPPYSIGDVYIKDSKYYRCRASRSEGNYNSLDWIPSTEYTDEMVGTDTKAELNRLEIEVHEGYVSNATFETTVNSINGRVEETYSYTNTVKNALDQTDEELEEVKNTVLANQTATEYSINVINQQLIDGVVKFDTGTGYTFDIEGLKINKTGSIMKLIIDNNGLVVYRNNDEVLRADSDGVNAENMTVRKFYVQKPIRVEKTRAISDSTKVGWGLFWVGE